MSSSISICIPSFNRKEHLIETLHRILSKVESNTPIEEVIFIDDGYDISDRNDIVAQMQHYTKFEYYKAKDTNSFGSVFLECFKAAKTDYVLITYDDDLFFTERIVDLQNFISDTQNWSLAVPAWKSGSNKLLRGSMKNRHVIETKKMLRYLAHAPGILYNLGSFSDELDTLRTQLAKNCVFSQMYPQVLLGALLLDGKKILVSLPIEIGQDGSELTTEIKTLDGEAYFSLRARLHQYMSLIDINDHGTLTTSTLDQLRVEFLARILLEHNRSISAHAVAFYMRRRLLISYRSLKHKIKKIISRSE